MIVTRRSRFTELGEIKMNEPLILLVNDYLTHLRGKLIRFILEESDMLAISNLVQVIHELGLIYNPETKMYEAPKEEETENGCR